MIKATVNGTTTLQLNIGQRQAEVDGKHYALDVVQTDEGHSHWLIENQSMVAEIVASNPDTKEFTVKVNSNTYRVQLKDKYDELLESLGMETAGKKRITEVKAPMPGLVLNVLVKEGDTVTKDTPLLILEAMKMENVIKSATDAVIKRICVVKGVPVEKNAVLIEFQ
jgi:biotin carboxyl carrier protein